MGAYRDFLKPGEHVQLGQGQGGSALQLHPVTGGHQVQPTYPAGPARGRAVLAAGLPQPVPLCVHQLAHEGAFPYAGGVGLGHPHHLTHLNGGQAAAQGRVGRQGRGGGTVGIDAVLDVPQGAQLGFKQNALALGQGLLEQLPRVADVGL